MMWLFLKNIFFLVAFPGFFGVYVPLRVIARVGPADARWGWPGTLAVAMVAVGAAGLAWCIWEFATRGGGTPAPFDPPRRLVVRGPYRVVRNPMYIALIGFVSGLALLFRSPDIGWYVLAVWAVFHLVVVLYEENVLGATFGEDYAAYRRAVRRWLPGRPMPRR